MSGILPGTIGLARIPGVGGAVVHFGQWLVTELDHVRLTDPDEAWADWEHAFIYLGNDQVMSAEPGGARLRPTSRYSEIYWCENIAARYDAGHLAQVAVFARQLDGTPYSFIDYAAIAAHTLHLPVPGLRSYIESTKHLICSQLCDLAYQNSGIQLFGDERWCGYVDPLDLYILDRNV